MAEQQSTERKTRRKWVGPVGYVSKEENEQDQFRSECGWRAGLVPNWVARAKSILRKVFILICHYKKQDGRCAVQEDPPDPCSCPSFSSESICHSEYLPFTAIVSSFRFNGFNYFQFFAPILFAYSFCCPWPIVICIDPFEFHFSLSLRFIFIVLFVPISSFWIQSISDAQ